MSRNIILLVSLVLLIGCGTKAARKPTPPPVSAPVIPPVYVIREKVNIRSENNTHSEIVTTLTDGEEIVILENRDGWYLIRFEGAQTGWIRSDLVGPKTLSRTILARAFVDSTLPAFSTEVFFDTQELYKVIYMILPEPAYASKTKTAEEAKKLGRVYQDKVYPGDLEIRVLKPGPEKELFMKVYLEAVNIADVPIPVLKYGRLYALDTPQKGDVRLRILVPPSVDDSELLAMARSISAIYAYPFTKAEIYMVEDSREGLSYLENRTADTAGRNVIRLYYLEDKDGEYYQFDVSGKTPAPY